MNVSIDSGSGFCFGVTGAIRQAEEELSKGLLFCLGDIVHNGQEVKRLEEKGLETIDYDDLRTLHNVRVLLRAHGEPPSTYHIARHNSNEIIDATCPVVKKLQERIHRTYEAHREAQIVIYGKAGHAEVIGLQGQTNNTAIIIESPHDLDKIDFNRDIYLFSQTTMSVEGFQEIKSKVESLKSADVVFEAHDTICRNVANRVANIKAFAAAQDVVLFVGGRKSSNAKVLFEHCREANPNSLFIESEKEITAELLQPLSHSSFADLKIGICGATSTPLWLMERCRDAVTLFEPSK
jgi:4-hydroxy-3-methylbut-2-enyl diphosphate reductase